MKTPRPAENGRTQHIPDRTEPVCVMQPSPPRLSAHRAADSGSPRYRPGPRAASPPEPSSSELASRPGLPVAHAQPLIFFPSPSLSPALTGVTGRTKGRDQQLQGPACPSGRSHVGSTLPTSMQPGPGDWHRDLWLPRGHPCHGPRPPAQSWSEGSLSDVVL